MKKILYLIRSLIPRGLQKQIYRLGMFFGGDQSFPSMMSALTYLKEWGFQPSQVIDVGAYHGQWSQLMKEVFPSTKILMIEAQEGKRAILEKICKLFAPDVSLELALLGAKDGEMVEFVEMESGSSVFEEQSPYFPRKRATKAITTLDTLIPSSYGWEKIDFLKLDVQGYELEVLKGASKYLSSCEFVLMEVSLIPVNKGCPLILDILSFMNTNRFRLLDFCSQYRRKDKSLWQTDLLFINEESSYLPRPRLDSTNW